MTPALASVLTFVAAAEEEFDPNDVTPGVIGFLVTILVMGGVLLLVLDMVRRIRRVNYRAEAQERLAAEDAERVEDADRAEDTGPAGRAEDAGRAEPAGTPDDGSGPREDRAG
ncbi:hypothetical protein [Agromyces marinus]|uniref:Uncharacterized protein n=1 Tax=Agromyces marinus TaxID=1389020 RepID=A0ABN6YKC3_9MICO|nr:hypothetical protein [Agromyces marinus]UIP59138.1 hypothetical protein DSM26151_20340 [Agromyces marinus]BDZ55868.1 hypothetical protein GCM10025870_29410 [Agromyces marinus]